MCFIVKHMEKHQNKSLNQIVNTEMSPSIHRSSYFLVFLYLFISANCMITNVNNKSDCQLWHFLKNGCCYSGVWNHGVVHCDKQFVSVKQGTCMTWNNATGSAEVHHCLFLQRSDDTCVMHDVYRIPTTVIGEKLNHFICSDYNRQGGYCSQCIDGYGPAMFSDDAICADCSKHRYLWILNLMFQLFMVTTLCLLLMLFQIKGTSSPLNVIIMYAQLITMGLKVDRSLHIRLSCYVGHTFTRVIVTSLGVFNLDFFHTIIPPLCVSPSFKSINILLFDYLIASYPLFLTMLIYLCIQVYDRQQILSFPTLPVRNCFEPFHTSWNPKRTILSTFATFLILSYSKLLFTSIRILLAFQSYNSHGEKNPSSPLLLYDPNIRFFHWEHIPYAMIALFTILIFIILPPVLLLTYPTVMFKKCLTCLRFQRWDIFNQIMDIFQGWFKDGTEGTRNYRPLSSFYLLYRIALSFEYAVQILLNNSYYNKHGLPRLWLILGVFNIFFGMAFFILQPYKQKWMSNFDGWTFTLAGMLLLLNFLDNKLVYNVGAVVGFSIMILFFIYTAYHKCKSAFKEHAVN